MLPALLVLAALTGVPPMAAVLHGPDHLGVWARSLHHLDRPAAVAFGPGELLWVAEEGAGRVRAFDPAGEQRAVLAGPLEAPAGIAIDEDGTVWVADRLLHEVLVFAPGGGLVARFGGLGSAPGRFHTPLGLALAPGVVAVADAHNRRVQVLDRSGTVLSAIALEAVGAHRPVDVAFTGAGELLVVDQDAHAVLRFDTDGAPAGRMGAFGFPPGLFARPGGIALSGGRAFVADTENHRVQAFDAELVRPGVPPLKQTPRYVLGQHAIRPREGRGKLHYPLDVAVSRDGEWLALCEPLDDRVQVFRRAPGERPEVDPLRPVGGQASPHYGPHLAVDGTCLAIVEPETQRILVFDLRQIDESARNDPLKISVLAGSGDGLGLFARPEGIDLDLAAAGRLWVCDPALRRLQELSLDFDPERELAQDFDMARAIRSLDFARLGRSVAGRELEWIVVPVSVAALGERVCVLDAANECIHVLDGDLSVARTLGGHGVEPGRLRDPVDLALSPDGERLIVADRGNSRVQVLDGEGRVLAVLGSGELDEPAGVAAGAGGVVWVSDEGRCEVIAFGPAGEVVARYGGPGIRRGELLRPRSISLSGASELYVVDRGNHRGVVLSPDLAYVDSFGSRLYTAPAKFPDRYRAEDYEE